MPLMKILPTLFQITILDVHSAEPSAEDWKMDTKPPIAYVHTTVVPIMTQVYEIKRLTTLLTLPKDALYGISKCRKMEQGCW